jgi:hypothetical protein
MKQIIVTYKNKPKPKKAPIASNLNWYNPITKEMQKLRPEQVEFGNKVNKSPSFKSGNLNWYDPIKQEMQYFEGDYLDFQYVEDEYLVAMTAADRLKKGIKSTYRMLPIVARIEKKSNEESEDKRFKKFFDNYLNYNVSNVMANLGDTRRAVCLVPDDEVEDFSYQLNRQGFYYEIE